MSSTRQNIIEEFRSRLQAILTADGYQTDAGQHVLVGEVPSFGPSDPVQAIALLLDDDAPGYQGANIVIKVPVAIHAVVKADVSDPCVAAEAVLADIKKAVETDRDLAGLAIPRGLERGQSKAAVREPGSEFVAAKVEYQVTYIEAWGNP